MELSQPDISSSTQKEILTNSFTTYGATKYGRVIAESGVKIGADKGRPLTNFVNFNASIGSPPLEVFSRSSIYISDSRLADLSRQLSSSTTGLPATTVTFTRYYLDSFAVAAGCCSLIVDGEPVSNKSFLGESCPVGWEETRVLSCDDYASIYPILECKKHLQRGCDAPPNTCLS